MRLHALAAWTALLASLVSAVLIPPTVESASPPTRWRIQDDDAGDGWVLTRGDSDGDGLQDEIWDEIWGADEEEQPLLGAETTTGKDQVNLVPVVLGVMSKCPDASLCEDTFDKVLSSVGNKVDLDLVYIGSLNSSATYGVTCKHGEKECKGNIQQLCYKRTYPNVKDWWSFIQCQNYAGLSKVGDDALAASCAKVGGKSWADVQACVDERGPKLLQSSVRTANHMGISTSCSIFINNRLVCIHDSVWRNCDNGHEPRDFVRQIEDEFEDINQ